MTHSLMKPVILAVLTLVAAVSFWAVAWISDDALIALRQVWLLGHGEGMTFNLGQRVQAFTHPAWFLLLSAGYFVSGSLYGMTLVVSALCWAVALGLYWQEITRRFSNVIEVFLLASLPLLSLAIRDYTSSGLETPLSFLLVALAFRLNGKALWLVLALTLLTRPDHAVQFGPLALWLMFTGQGRWRDIWPGVAVLIGWHGFSLIYFGMPLPNTYYAKMGAGVGFETRLGNAILFYLDAARHLEATLILIGAGLVLGLRGAGRDRMLALGVALHLVYLIYIGGDFMRGRFLAVDAFIACWLIARLAPAMGARWLSIVVLGVALIVTRPYLAPLHLEAAEFKKITDERLFYAKPYALRSPDRAWPDPHVPEIKPITSVRAQCGLLGGVRLRWPDDIWVVDVCGLADPFLARVPALTILDQRPGHLIRGFPENYDAVIVEGAVLSEPSAQALYDDIQLATRGPLFTSERWRAIWHLMTKEYDIDRAAWQMAQNGVIARENTWLRGARPALSGPPPGLEYLFENK